MRFFKDFLGSRRVYLDYASSTPTDRRMLRSIPPIDARIAGANPSALHKEGVGLKQVLAAARQKVARVLDVHSDEIFFTSGATESDNLALQGTIDGLLAEGIPPSSIAIYSSELEHAAVAETIAHATKRDVVHIPLLTNGGVVEPKGIVLPEGVMAAVITVMYVSNEVGTVQPIADIAKRIRRLRKDHPKVRFIFHTDATQAPLYHALRVPTLGVDLMTLGGTKLYAGKGVGVLYKKRKLTVAPIMYGGGQEGGLRPGTPTVAQIHEFACALEYGNVTMREKETARIKKIQSTFENLLKKSIPQLRVGGDEKERSPHISHIGIPNFDSELLVLELDARGVAVSAKSACKNEDATESPVVEKLYGEKWGGIRFSFGRMTTVSEVKKAAKALRAVLRKYQK